jgi:hypothetical protein
LTSLTSSKVKFEWHSSHQKTFVKIKKVIGTEVILCHPDFNKPGSFHLYTDTSDYQLGAVIMQDKIKTAIAFYSRKLNTAQKRYTTTERELLSAIETCKVIEKLIMVEMK